MSANEQDIVCIVCARGCRARVKEERGRLHIAGRLCRNGREYVAREFHDPRRTLTTTVRVEGGSRSRLPVRTRGPIPRDRQLECMRAIAVLRVRPPVHPGQVIVADLLGTGQDLIATAGISERAGPTPPESGPAWRARP